MMIRRCMSEASFQGPVLYIIVELPSSDWKSHIDYIQFQSDNTPLASKEFALTVDNFMQY